MIWNSTFLYCFKLLGLFFCQCIMLNRDTVFKSDNCCIGLIVKKLMESDFIS